MKQRQIGIPTSSALEDAWQRRATAAAIAAARKVIDTDSAIPPGTQIGRLSDVEWGWLVAAILFGWIGTRAQQGTAEEIDTERCIRMTGSILSHGTPEQCWRSCRNWRMPALTSIGRSRSHRGRARP